ncbi:MAG: PEGA domain-containing protein [Candidatus Asgardarchaeia archaeon]
MKGITIPLGFQRVEVGGKWRLEELPTSFTMASFLLEAYRRYGYRTKVVSIINVPLSLLKLEYGTYILREPMGLVSTDIEVFKINKDLREMLSLMEEGVDYDRFVSICKELASVRGKTEELEVEGILPQAWISEISRILEFRREGMIENGIVLDVELSEIRDAYKVKECFHHLKSLMMDLEDVERRLEESFNRLKKKLEAEIELWIERYEAEIDEMERTVSSRIEELKNEMDTQISRVEEWFGNVASYYKRQGKRGLSQIKILEKEASDRIEKIKENYKKLIEAEKKKLKELIKERDEIVNPLMERKEKMSEVYQKALDRLHSLLKDVKDSIESIKTHTLSLNLGEEATLMIPFVFISGENEWEILPISILKRSKGFSFLSGFSVPLEPLSEFWQSFSEMLKSRIRTHVETNAILMKESKKKNLLEDKNFQELVKDGLRLLFINGWIKKEAILSKVLKMFREFPKEEREEVKLREGEVVVKVIDDDGMPLEGAEIIVKGSTYKTSQDGICNIRLKEGTYKVRVCAKGYRELKDEISVYPDAYTSKVFKLEKYSKSELLSMELPKIIDVVRKEGIGSLVVEEYVKELSKRIGLDEERVWHEIYKKWLNEMMKRGKKEDALEAAILFIINKFKEKGGIAPFSDVLLEMQKVGITLNSKDLEKVLTKFIRRGLIHGMREVEGVKIVFFVSIGWSGDTRKIIELAAKHGGELTRENIILETGWPEDKVELILGEMERSGIASSGFIRGRKVWWFPALYKTSSKKSS